MTLSSSRPRVAVVLFNLGGPDKPEAVRPFLFNLFKDRAIIRLPAFLRLPLAWLISTRRAPKTREIYAQIGGKSPLLELTRAQASALEIAMQEYGQCRVFVAMRYWHPFAAQTAREVQAFAPEKIILLPLYPQFSTTTTASSFDDWDKAARQAGISAPMVKICCYPAEPGFVAAHADTLRKAYWEASADMPPRVLFSAHGLPEKIIAEGDPYQWQVEQTVRAVVSVLSIPDLDYRICYQSRVGPLRWIGPSTEEEIARAGEEGKPVLIVPVAFVSEHSETLVELDVEYAHLAKERGVPAYVRAPALGVHALFIESLAALCRQALAREGGACASDTGGRRCPAPFSGCPCLR